jgi:hypothetical protein
VNSSAKKRKYKNVKRIPDSIPLTPQNYISPLNKISNLSNLSKSHSKPSIKFSKENQRQKYIDRTKSTRMNLENTPENIFPFSIFEENIPVEGEKVISKNVSYLEKRSDMNSLRNDSPGNWIRNSIKKKEQQKHLKKVRGVKLCF